MNDTIFRTHAKILIKEGIKATHTAAIDFVANNVLKGNFKLLESKDLSDKIQEFLYIQGMISGIEAFKHNFELEDIKIEASRVLDEMLDIKNAHLQSTTPK